MKFLSLLLFALFISTSCCGAKDAKANTTKEIAQLETPKTPEPEKVIEVVKEEISSTEEIDDVEIPNKIEETPITPKSDDIVKTIELAEAFNHSVWNDLLQKYVTNEGNVNYKGFKSDYSKLKKYITALSETMPTDSWTKEDKLAYWMNTYNALTIDLILRNYPLKSIRDINKPWAQRLWKLGDTWYNLEDIEHKILRKMNEPRIHFGIVCASYSCPKLQNEAFEASTVYAQLTKATKEFLADSNRNEISQNSIKISKIFSWFSKDFKQNGSLIDFLNTYSDVKISNSAKKSYKSYNWSLNE